MNVGHRASNDQNSFGVNIINMPANIGPSKSLGGAFLISLDFELMWGVRDQKSIAEYGSNIIGVRKAIPAMIQLFSQYEIRSTFATVGFLFASDQSELMAALPTQVPHYRNPKLSPYGDYLKQIGKNEGDDPYHYGSTLIDFIAQAGHEIGCHTFSHYYCLEQGQSLEEFRADLKAARAVAQRKGFHLNSIVFPRNQYNGEYIRVCREEGIASYRGSEKSWIYKSSSGEDQTIVRRIVRLVDSYINLSGHHSFEFRRADESGLLNLPSSRFLRPFSRRLAFLEHLRLRRIKKSMTHAAQNDLAYHLWWHPHNFGLNLKKNLEFLESILRHYKQLEHAHGFRSVTMEQLAVEASPQQ
jgi:hypothetical protein